MFCSPFLFVLVVFDLLIVGAYFVILLGKEVTKGIFYFILKLYDALDDTKRLK